ncbi:MAG: glutamate-1-semialdehyde 2,1-aminomutase [Streptosporangiales bacterium]|nr:glutamate-1-semialdehyde 2,1-aminomutase [Streptosporangiales bacterium]
MDVVQVPRIAGALLLRPSPHVDARGFFSRTFDSAVVRAAGLDPYAFVQDSLSRSVRGVVRGLHLRSGDGEAKLVRCSAGAVFDVVVDMRPDSPTYGNWESFELSGDTQVTLYVPRGCAHGFQALTEPADVAYRIDREHDPAEDVTIAFDDPELAIPWPLPVTTMSARDRGAAPGTAPTPEAGLPRSSRMTERLHALVPGGAHTYAKGDDQYPQGLAPIISHGRGAHVWDVDGNEYVEYGSGLRSVGLGHAHPRVTEAVTRQLERGANFARPGAIEVEAAERFLRTVPTADMVKFAKNGSDVTTAAVRLARAVTGRPLVAICGDHPFFSTDDWFIATTPMASGIPGAVGALTVSFPYGDLAATAELLRRHDGEIACLMLEAATQHDPPDGYLAGLRDLAHAHGCLLVFDEMITGFRWADAGAQGLYGVTPDLSTFGKALGNGFAVSALAGRREIMEPGGLRSGGDRVFLLSTTHGAETHALAAAMAVQDAYEAEGVIARMHALGDRLATGVREVTAATEVGEHVVVRGRASNLVFATLDGDGRPSQEYRTLFLRQLLLGGVIAPSFVVSAALTDADIDHTVDVVAQACAVYAKALDAGDPGPWMGGRPVKPVFRLRA